MKFMKKGMEKLQTPEAPVMEMARRSLLQAKEMEMTDEQRQEINELVTKAVDAEKAGNLSAALNLLQQVKAKMETIHGRKLKRENLEQEFNLQEQYDQQVETLKQVGILQEFKNGQWGMIDILGQEQLIPSYQEIKDRMEAKAEMLDKKREQGFTQLLLVPIGMKLSEIAEKAGKLIIKKHKEGKLLATDGTKLELDENQPVFVNDEYKDADINGNLVYGVKKFDKDNHGGQTKSELLSGWLANRSSESVGWQVMFIEDLPDLPEKGKGKDIEGRQQFDAGQSPEQYLAKIQTEEQYADEQFTTPEAQLIYLIQQLQHHDQMIDDWDGQGKGCWNAGAYFKGKGAVPFGRWNRFNRQFRLDWRYPGSHSDGGSVRASVKF